VNILII